MQGTLHFLMDLVHDLIQDLRFAFRQLRRNPGLAFGATVVLGVGLAACTTVFAFVDAALVRPLPYRDPSRIVALYESIPVGDRYHLSQGDYEDWKRDNHVFSSLDVFRVERATITGAARAEQVHVARVSDGFFRTLGVAPVLGRDFRPGEDARDAEPTVILSYGAWLKRFGGNKDVIGHTVTMDGVSFRVLGVLGAPFHFAPVGPAEFWITLRDNCPQDGGRECHAYYGVARLKDGVSVASASADMRRIAHQIALAFPKSNRDRGATVLPLTDVILGDVRPILVSLLSGAQLLLLIGFVNVVSLLLVRAESRRRELAVRGALGATPSRLVRQFAAEGLLLALGGLVSGLSVAAFATEVVMRQIPPELRESMPYLAQVHLDARSFLFTSAAALFGGILFALLPALPFFSSGMERGLAEGGRTAAGRTWRKMGTKLVVVELGLAMMLLVSAGLLGRSFYNLLHVDIGIAPDHLSVLHIVIPLETSGPQRIDLQRQIQTRLTGLPGVVSTGISYKLSVGEDDGFGHFRVAGRRYVGDGDEAFNLAAGVGYFETIRARLVEGRYFTEADDATRPPVAIINQTLARQFFPGEDPIGKHIISQYDPEHPWEIVGVIRDIREGPLNATLKPAVYTAEKQNPDSDVYVTVRSANANGSLLPAMVAAVHAIDPRVVANEADTMEARINDSQAAYLHRAAAWVVSGFAGLALALGTVGLYGVISYAVGQRTREVGVRMALGAPRLSIYQLILTEACWLVLVGIACGLLGSWAATGILRGLLFGVTRWDVGTLAAVICLLAGCALLASYLPARRAASISPTEALRAE